MRLRVIGIAALVALRVTVPSGASAATTCGTTPAQWVGTFSGNENGHHEDPSALSLVISDALKIDTNVRYEETATPLGAPTIADGTLRWSVEFIAPLPHGAHYHQDHYVTTAATCAGGQVVEFSGTLRIWHYQGTENGTFTVRRMAAP